jgi:UDP-N-acetylmuramyl pentapeptide synthase
MAGESMKISELLDELKEEIENSPKSVFSNKRSVDVDIIHEIIADINAALPEEMKQAKKIAEEKEQIIAAARDEAAAIISSAEDELQTRISEDEIVREAEIKAGELKELAQSNAKEIIMGAREYADDILKELETYFADYLKMIRKNRMELSTKRKE